MFDQVKKFFDSIMTIPPHEWVEFQKGFVVKKYRAGDIALYEGDVCNEIFFIGKGAFRMYYVKEEVEINTIFMFENYFIVNYQSFLTQEPSRYYIQAMEDAEVISVSYEFINFVYKNLSFGNELGRLMAEQGYKNMTKRLEAFAFYNAEERYLALIKMHPYIFERVPLYHIASYLGIAGPSLSRLRKRLLKNSRNTN